MDDTFDGIPPARPRKLRPESCSPQALGDPVADPAELCWLLTAPDHS
ncbi:MAG TPA: hypothetical protein VFR31_10990 [Thermoanaerobaculia bacterium]|nr:hypothetical protein [Thermoanaerobaculia bacterium]